MPSGILPYTNYAPRESREDSASQCTRLFYQLCFKRRSNNFLFFILALCICGYIWFYFMANDLIVVDTSVEHAVDSAVIQKRKDFTRVTIDRECSTTSNRCFIVSDSDDVRIDGVRRVMRGIFVEGVEDSDTEIELLPKKEGEKFESSDTRMWIPVSGSIKTDYLAFMAIFPFLMGTLPVEESNSDGRRPHTVLSIGLGGGALDMFWHNLNRNMDITVVELDSAVVKLANKWFGVVEDAKRRTIVGDGVKFIRDAANKGKRYDTIAIDACDEDKVRPCPISAFLESDVVQKTADALSEDGVLIVNILPMGDKKKIVDEVVEALSGFFPTCMRVTCATEVNVLLGCSLKSHQNMEQFYEGRIHFLLKTFKLGDIVRTFSMV